MSLAAKEAKSQTPKAAWNLRDIRDTRENARAAVESAAFVPAGAKAMILETIDAQFASSRLLKLDAHVHEVTQNERKTLSVAITIAEL